MDSEREREQDGEEQFFSGQEKKCFSMKVEGQRAQGKNESRVRERILLGTK